MTYAVLLMIYEYFFYSEGRSDMSLDKQITKSEIQCYVLSRTNCCVLHILRIVNRVYIQTD